MTSKEAAVSAFGKTFRLLNVIALKTSDDFFSELCGKQADKLLSAFIEFLKEEGTTNVAQLRHNLIFQKEAILDILSVLKYLKLTDSVPPLLLEKNLLLLESAISDITKSSVIKVKKRSNVEAKVSKPKIKIQTQVSTSKLTDFHNQILALIKSKDSIQNLEIFSQFPAISKRTLKRRLSELISSGAIVRQTQGKKVFYSAI
jgi:hypothetical protein